MARVVFAGRILEGTKVLTVVFGPLQKTDVFKALSNRFNRVNGVLQDCDIGKSVIGPVPFWPADVSGPRRHA